MVSSKMLRILWTENRNTEGFGAARVAISQIKIIMEIYLKCAESSDSWATNNNTGNTHFSQMSRKLRSRHPKEKLYPDLCGLCILP